MTGTEQAHLALTCFLETPHPHDALCISAEFDIWYNESFFVPEDLQMALKPGGGIRPGMMPLSKIVSLVSGTRWGWGWWMSTGQCPVPPAPSTSMAVDGLLLAFLQLPQAGGQA